MGHIKAISIPEPCHQSWRDMLVTDSGRYCGHCCKTVVDFDAMSTNDIMNYLSDRKDVCGRFRQEQLNGINYQLYTQNLPKAAWWKQVAIVIAMLGATSLKADGQPKSVVVRKPDTTLNNKRSRLPLITVPSPGNDLLKEKDRKNSCLENNLQSVDLSSTTQDSVQHTAILGGVQVVALKFSLPKKIWFKIKELF